jgi:hypothetical protein
VQPLVLERQPCGGPHGPHQARFLLERGVEEQGGDPLSVFLEHVDRASRAPLDLDRDSVRVHEDRSVGKPVRHLERRVP